MLNENRDLVPDMALEEVLTTVEPVAVGLLHSSLALADRSSDIASMEMLEALISICKGSAYLEVPSNSTSR